MAEGSGLSGGGAIATGTTAPAAPNSHGWVDKRSFPRRLRSMLALEDFEGAARDYLPRPIFGYVAGGVDGRLRNDTNYVIRAWMAVVAYLLADYRFIYG